MPIGVPRIIYCWGEELPAQWTDIYNFIFRRRMVFLMQYLDDELCNQICGLLINIHMEDRSKELERKETSSNNLFSSSSMKKPNETTKNQYRSVEDLMISEEDLKIDENSYLNNQTLQKISLEWLNWNSEFLDYSDEPYLFYLAELLAQDVTKPQTSNMYEFSKDKNFLKLLKIFQSNKKDSGDPLSIYSPFRSLSNFASNENINLEFNPKKHKKFEEFQKNFTNKLAQKKFFHPLSKTQLNQQYNQVLTQRQLRQNYTQETSSYETSENQFLAYRDYYRKQTERSVQEDESKKVFMVINSFGGSVGNGITVHDALQFIKAGSMTLALGVAASAASLALAGGTIGERYVTEGCHVMVHQPESSLSGQASDIWIDSLEIMKIRLDVAEIYSLSTYRPKHKILRDLDRDFYLTATEAIYYGLADEIATNDVMHSIIEMTSKVWDYHDTQQQKLLESRESATAGLDTQTQNS